jgi:hypothetical protein
VDDGGELFHTISSSRDILVVDELPTWGRERSLIALSKNDKPSLGYSLDTWRCMAWVAIPWGIFDAGSSI